MTKRGQKEEDGKKIARRDGEKEQAGEVLVRQPRRSDGGEADQHVLWIR